MVDQSRHNSQNEDSGQGLRQALMRLTSPHYEDLQAQIDSLQKSLENLNLQISVREEQLEQQDKDLQVLIQETQENLARLESSLQDLDLGMHSEISQQTNQIEQRLNKLQTDLNDPQLVGKRITPLFLPILNDSVRTEQDEFARAVSPVIGPAIRHQIRDSRQDIIDSLYPIIGQIISKAIAESIRELTRNIDQRLKRQFNLRSQIRRLSGRLRGVSEAEILLRESLPYNVQHVFLIHRPTGILLEHLSNTDEQVEDADIVSSMLTAIRDFVSDSFGDEEQELEEITHGERRFLIESGMYAYIAVVVDGTEPSGYHTLISQAIQEINLKFELDLKRFDGQLDRLPSFTAFTRPLVTPEQALLELRSEPETMSTRQRRGLIAILIGIILLLGLISFACLFSYRLWPLAFPGPTATATLTQTVTLTPTSSSTPKPSDTPEPSNTPTKISAPTQTQSLTPSLTNSPSATAKPTSTSTSQPTPSVQIGLLTGNLNLRNGPSTRYPLLGMIEAGEQVVILEQQGFWYHVQWPIEGETLLDGWLWEQYVIFMPSP
jgi:hypothetical protein